MCKERERERMIGSNKELRHILRIRIVKDFAVARQLRVCVCVSDSIESDKRLNWHTI